MVSLLCLMNCRMAGINIHISYDVTSFAPGHHKITGSEILKVKLYLYIGIFIHS